MFPPNRSIQCDGLGVRQHRAAEFLPPKRYRGTSMPLLPQNPLSHKAKGEWLLAPAVNESQVARRDSPSNGWRNVALLGLRAEMDPFKQRAMRHGVRVPSTGQVQ